MRNPELITEIEALVESRSIRALRERIETMHAADVAELIEDMPVDQAALVFRVLPKDEAAEVISWLEGPQQTELLATFGDREQAHLIESMFIDDAVDLIEELPSNAVRRILALSSPETRSTLNRYLQYPEHSAGSIMTEEFIRLRATTTVGEAIRAIRADRQKRVSLHTCYVTSDDAILLGVVSISEILVSPDDAIVGELGERMSSPSPRRPTRRRSSS